MFPSLFLLMTHLESRDTFTAKSDNWTRLFCVRNTWPRAPGYPRFPAMSQVGEINISGTSLIQPLPIDVFCQDTLISKFLTASFSLFFSILKFFNFLTIRTKLLCSSDSTIEGYRLFLHFCRVKIIKNNYILF